MSSICVRSIPPDDRHACGLRAAFQQEGTEETEKGPSLVTLQANGSRSRQTLDRAPFDANGGQILANSATIDARHQMAEVLPGLCFLCSLLFQTRASWLHLKYLLGRLRFNPRFTLLAVFLLGVAGICRAETESPIAAQWEMPPRCDPFAPPRIADLKEELRQTGYRLVIAIHPERTGGSDKEYPPRDLYLVNADGSGLRRLTETPGTEERVPRTSPDGKWFTYNYGDYLVDVATLKTRTIYGGYVWPPRQPADRLLREERGHLHRRRDRPAPRRRTTSATARPN